MSNLSTGFTDGDDFRFVYDVGGRVFAGGGGELIFILDKVSSWAVNGEGGQDTIFWTAGENALTGGEGADVFEFYTGSPTGDDLITDCEDGFDRIGIYGEEAEAKIIYEDWGVMVLIEGPKVFSLTIKDPWETDLSFMG